MDCVEKESLVSQGDIVLFSLGLKAINMLLSLLFLSSLTNGLEAIFTGFHFFGLLGMLLMLTQILPVSLDNLQLASTVHLGNGFIAIELGLAVMAKQTGRKL